MLKRYDLASEVARSLAWEIFALNLDDYDWKSVDEAKQVFVDRVMETRPGLDRETVRGMFLRMMLARN